MKYVKTVIKAKLPLLNDAEIVPSPDAPDIDCLKIGKDFYDIDFLITKYNKKRKLWEGVDEEDILDDNYVPELNIEYTELKSKPVKV